MFELFKEYLYCHAYLVFYEVFYTKHTSSEISRLIVGEVSAYHRSLSDYNTFNITSYDTILLSSRHHINGYDLAGISSLYARAIAIGDNETLAMFLLGEVLLCLHA